MGVSVAMVGLGSFGRQFVPLFRDHPQVSRLALCDVHADRLASARREFGLAECYDSLEDVLATDIDAVVLITQPWLHHGQALQALRAGKHVYSAVPPVYGPNGQELLEALDDLVNAVRATGQLYMLGETSYFRREIMYCRARAAEGAFGAFTYAECEYWHDLDSPTSNLREVARRRWGAQFGIWFRSRRRATATRTRTGSCRIRCGATN